MVKKKSVFPLTKLSDVVSMKSGESITAERITSEGKYPCFGGNGFRGYTTTFTHDGSYTLVGRQGALCGNVTFVSGRFYASEHAVVVSPKKETDIKFMSYVLYDMNLNRYSESSAQPGLSVKKVLELEFPIPKSKEEQTAIAEALSDVDSLIFSLQKLIEKKKAIKQGAMQELLTGKKRLPGFSGEWKELNFVESAKLKARIGWQGLTTSEYLQSGYAYLVTGTDFHNGKIGWETCRFVDKKRYKQDLNIQIKNHDILLTKDGTIGKVAYIFNIQKPTTLNSGVLSFALQKKIHLRQILFIMC